MIDAARCRCIATCLALAAGVAGCAWHTERIVLLPSKDGHATALIVKQGDREVVLDRPYAATELTRADPWNYGETPREIEATFGAALAAQPARAEHFTLYFIEASDELTESSKDILKKVFANLATRTVPDVVVVGHTDAVGSNEFNDALARKRADRVRDAMIARGVSPENIVARGRGKRELLIPTGDNVAEPRNRRVEIIVQ